MTGNHSLSYADWNLLFNSPSSLHVSIKGNRLDPHPSSGPTVIPFCERLTQLYINSWTLLDILHSMSSLVFLYLSHPSTTPVLGLGRPSKRTEGIIFGNPASSLMAEPRPKGGSIRFPGGGGSVPAEYITFHSQIFSSPVFPGSLPLRLCFHSFHRSFISDSSFSFFRSCVPLGSLPYPARVPSSTLAPSLSLLSCSPLYVLPPKGPF